MHEMKTKLKRQKKLRWTLLSFVQNKTNEKILSEWNEQKEMKRSEIFFK